MLSGQKKLKRVKQVMKELEMLKNVNQLLIQFQYVSTQNTFSCQFKIKYETYVRKQNPDYVLPVNKDCMKLQFEQI
jgi:hypothetical protein